MRPEFEMQYCGGLATETWLTLSAFVLFHKKETVSKVFPHAELGRSKRIKPLICDFAMSYIKKPLLFKARANHYLCTML